MYQREFLTVKNGNFLDGKVLTMKTALQNEIRKLKQAGAKVREVTISVSTCVESAANTFTDAAIALSSHFSQRELEAGVYLIGAYIHITRLLAGSAANKHLYTQVGISKSDDTGLREVTSSKLLAMKKLEGSCGADASCLNFQAARQYPSDGVITDLRDHKIDKDNPDSDLYWQIASSFLAAANSASIILYFGVNPL